MWQKRQRRGRKLRLCRPATIIALHLEAKLMHKRHASPIALHDFAMKLLKECGRVRPQVARHEHKICHVQTAKASSLCETMRAVIANESSSCRSNQTLDFACIDSDSFAAIRNRTVSSLAKSWPVLGPIGTAMQQERLPKRLFIAQAMVMHESRSISRIVTACGGAPLVPSMQLQRLRHDFQLRGQMVCHRDVRAAAWCRLHVASIDGSVPSADCRCNGVLMRHAEENKTQTDVHVVNTVGTPMRTATMS
jgi:hypothetical protein